MMRLRLPVLCLGLAAAPALAAVAADARTCPRQAVHSGELALAGIDRPPTPPRASGSLRLSIGATFPL